LEDATEANEEASLKQNPQPNHYETAEQLLHGYRQELKEMESNLRVKGDYTRADAVHAFRVEWFGEEDFAARTRK